MTLSYIYGKILKRIQGTCVLNSSINRTSKIGPSCNIINCKLDRYSYIGHDSQFVFTDIGAFCSISDHVNCGDAEHPLDWLSTSPVFQKVNNSSVKKRFARIEIPKYKRTVIGNDVWVGHNVTIKQGIVIGNGAVIASGAVVTKDIPDYAIVGGVPAKFIRSRFDMETIHLLQKSEWWNWQEDEIIELGQFVSQKEQFVEYLRKRFDK